MLEDKIKNILEKAQDFDSLTLEYKGIDVDNVTQQILAIIPMTINATDFDEAYDIKELKAQHQKEIDGRPTIVCLCGSTRFSEAFQKAQLDETLAGRIVLTIGCNMKTDTEIFGHLPTDELDRIKEELDKLHKRKIDLADEVLILNVSGYIGESTRGEIEYAAKLNKGIRYLESP